MTAALAVGAGGCGSTSWPHGAQPAASSPSLAPTGAPAAVRHSQPRIAPVGVLTEPQAGIGPVYRLITGARSSVDLSIQELADPAAEQDLAADAARGVDVRVILDQRLEKSRNTSAYDYPAGHGVHVTHA